MSEEYAMVVEFVKSLKPPKELRSALDIGFKFENGTAGLSADPNDYQKSSFAKFRFVKSRRIWKLYWMRSSGK